MDHSGSTGLVNFTETQGDENSWPQQEPSKKRRFETNSELEPADRKLQLAKEIDLKLRQVANQLENDYVCLKSSYDKLMTDFDVNDKLMTDFDALFNEIDELNNQAASPSKDVPRQPKELEKKRADEISSDGQLKEPLDVPIADTLSQQRSVLAKQMTNLYEFTYDHMMEIAKRVKRLEDFTSFSSTVKEESSEGPRLRKGTPYLMLPVREDGTNVDVRELYSLVAGESTVAYLKVPILKKDTMCYESLGWLLAVQEDGSMSLVDPFSNTNIPVPHPDTMPKYEQYVTDEKRMFIEKMVLSSTPNETSNFILMVICGRYKHLAFWRPGDVAWTWIDTLKSGFTDVVYDGGELFYAISYPGIIWAINLASGNIECRIIIDSERTLPSKGPEVQNQYIVKAINGSLLAVTRTKDNEYYITSIFDVYEINTEKGTWKEIDSLESMAVFLGRNSSIAVDALKFPGVIKANHIYFTDDYMEFQNLYFTGDKWKAFCFYSEKADVGSVDSGVYNNETEEVDPIYPVKPLSSNVCPAMFISPN